MRNKSELSPKKQNKKKQDEKVKEKRSKSINMRVNIFSLRVLQKPEKESI